MTERYAKIIRRSIEKEDAVIGNLKDRFVKKSLRSQIHTSISPSEITGNIALSYHRGLAVGREERKKEIIALLKNKFPKAATFLKSKL